MLETQTNVNVSIGSVDLNKYETAAKEDVSDILSRAGKSGQFPTL